MKKTLTIIVLLSFIFNAYCQPPPVNKRAPLTSTSNTANNTLKSKKAYYSEKEEKKEHFYIELKLQKNEKGEKLILPKKIYRTTKNKETLQKIEYLEKLTNTAKEEHFNILNSINGMGFKLISHSFALNKEGEIHYYIFEL